MTRLSVGSFLKSLCQKSTIVTYYKKILKNYGNTNYNNTFCQVYVYKEQGDSKIQS